MNMEQISTNILYYGSNRCINEIILSKLKGIHNVINMKEVLYKNISYYECPYFFLFYASDNQNILHCVKELIMNHSVIRSRRHKVIIFDIERLESLFFSFRILLERFFTTTQFICTTSLISNIEKPLLSRFFIIRQPHNESNHVNIELIRNIKKKPTIQEIQIISKKLKDYSLGSIIYNCLQITPYKHQYLEISAKIENHYQKSHKKNKIEFIELILIELFYPTHNHTL